jgi:hypothetical protein
MKTKNEIYKSSSLSGMSTDPCGTMEYFSFSYITSVATITRKIARSPSLVCSGIYFTGSSSPFQLSFSTGSQVFLVHRVCRYDPAGSLFIRRVGFISKRSPVTINFFSRLSFIKCMAQFFIYKAKAESRKVETAGFNKIFVPDSLTTGML